MSSINLLKWTPPAYPMWPDDSDLGLAELDLELDFGLDIPTPGPKVIENGQAIPSEMSDDSSCTYSAPSTPRTEDGDTEIFETATESETMGSEHETSDDSHTEDCSSPSAKPTPIFQEADAIKNANASINIVKMKLRLQKRPLDDDQDEEGYEADEDVDKTDKRPVHKKRKI